MALKNWLIRTKNKQILGPATKDKVIELIEKGSLSQDDQIACGNGYWIWVREKDLLEKYLYGDLPQTFNPISEAQDVLTAKSSPDGVTASVLESPQKAREKSIDADANHLPDQDDLAYPDMGELEYPEIDGSLEIEETDPFVERANQTAEIEVTKELPSVRDEFVDGFTEGEEENFLYPAQEDLEYPEMEEVEEEAEEEMVVADDDVTDPNVHIPVEASVADLLAEAESEQELPQRMPKEETDTKKKVAKKKGKRRRKIIKERTGNDRYLIYIALFILMAIGVVIYYYKAVLNKPIPVIGMQEAHAQTIQSLSKKKTFIH